MNNLFGNVLKSSRDILQQVGPIPTIWSWSPFRTLLVSRWKKPKKPRRDRPKSSGSYKGKGVQRLDGDYVFPGDKLVIHQRKFWYHPGLNVTAARHHLNLVALKEGVVRVTVEQPDLNYNHTWVQTFYAGQQGHVFFKKYYHVIPPPQHNRFKCIDQI